MKFNKKLNFRSECILFVADFRVDNINGNFKRQEQLLQYLCENYHVELLNLGGSCKSTRQFYDRSLPELEVRGGASVIIYRLVYRAWYVLNTLLCNKLQIIGQWYCPRLLPIYPAMGREYKHVIYFYMWNARIFEYAKPRESVVIDLNDVMGNRHERIGARRWISLSFSLEQEIIRSAKFTPVAITDDDADEFNRLYGTKPEVIPYVEWPAAEVIPSVGAKIGFLGARNNFSEDLVQFLLTSNFCYSLAALGVEFILAGSCCDFLKAEDQKELEKRGVDVIGKVGDARHFYNQVSCVLNLTGPSTGAKIKSIEALCENKKLITTRFGIDSYTHSFFKDVVHFVEWPINETELINAVVAQNSPNVTDREMRPRSYASAVRGRFDRLFELQAQ